MVLWVSKGGRRRVLYDGTFLNFEHLYTHKGNSKWVSMDSATFLHSLPTKKDVKAVWPTTRKGGTWDEY